MASRPPKSPSLPTPAYAAPHLAEQTKKVLQLFDGNPAKRLEAVVALGKGRFRLLPQTALYLAALEDPDSAVRLIALKGLESRLAGRGYQNELLLRAAVARLRSDADPLQRAALATVARRWRLPVEPADLEWLQSVDSTEARELIGELARTHPPALEFLMQQLANPEIAGLALPAIHNLGAEAQRAIASLIPVLQHPREYVAENAAHALARFGAAATAALPALDAKRHWSAERAAALIAPERISALLQAHPAWMDEKDNQWAVVALLAQAPQEASLYLASHVLPEISKPPYPEMMAQLTTLLRIHGSALQAQLEDILDKADVYSLRWQAEAVDAAVGAAGSAAVLNKVRQLAPQLGSTHFSYQAQFGIEKCCAVLLRHPIPTTDGIDTLVNVAMQQQPNLISGLLPTVRVLHRWGATAAQLQPLVDAFEREASRSEAKHPDDPSWAAKTRLWARLLLLPDLASVHAAWRDVETMRAAAFSLDRAFLLEWLKPYLADPKVKSLFQQGLQDSDGEVQDKAALALGLSFFE